MKSAGRATPDYMRHSTAQKIRALNKEGYRVLRVERIGPKVEGAEIVVVLNEIHPEDFEETHV